MSGHFTLRTLFWLTAGVAAICASWRATDGDEIALMYVVFWILFCVGAIRENRRSVAALHCSESKDARQS